MSLTERINRRQDNPNIAPLVERRAERMPEWRRRALELQAKVGNVAVTDLTEAA